MSSSIKVLKSEDIDAISEPPSDPVSDGMRAWWIALATVILLVWGPRLGRSFWVDEAGTWWMAHDGPIAAIQKTWHWPGQSLLYSVIASLFCLQTGPFREFVLRMPSLFGIGVACYFLYRLAEKAIGRGAGFITLVLFTLNPVIYYTGTEARPYGLALGAVAASCWALYNWVETRNRRYLPAYLIASTLILYLHYLFLGIFLVQAVYLAYVFVVERRIAKWQHIVGVYAAMLAFALPLLPHLRLLLREGRTLPFLSASPTLFEFVVWTLPPFVIFGLFIAALLVQMAFLNRARQSSAPDRATLLFLSAWLLLVPALYLIVSMKTRTVVFVDRYMSFSLEALALLLAAAGYMFFGARRGRIWVTAGVLLTTASPIVMLNAWKPGHDDLMPFMRVIQSESKTNPPPPVLFRSELPESNSKNWRSGLQGDNHLYAPFVVYPMPNQLIPLPFHFTKEVKAYISDKLDSELRNAPKVIFVTHDISWNPWIVKRMGEAGFVGVRKEQPNYFTVIVFERPKPGETLKPAKDLVENPFKEEEVAGSVD
jgi:hypothetical protein